MRDGRRVGLSKRECNHSTGRCIRTSSTTPNGLEDTMSVSIRPAYRSGRTPPAPPAAVAPAALLAALVIALAGVAYRQACGTAQAAPRMVTPTVSAPAQAHAPASPPAPRTQNARVTLAHTV